MKSTSSDKIVTTVISLIAVGVILAILAGLAFGIPAFFRYQKVKGANNFVKTSQIHANNQTILNEIQIQQTKQLVEVENQKAAVRVAEAKGISAAMDLIQANLTDQYLQHEAIQAQLKMAASPNHTQIYIPTGQNGIPIVKTLP